MKEILIFSELTPDFKITNVVLELASKAKELAQKLDNTKLCAVIVNKNANYDEINSTLSKYGFDKVYILKNDCYSRYSTFDFHPDFPLLAHLFYPSFFTIKLRHKKKEDKY